MGDVAAVVCGGDASHDAIPLDFLGVVELVAAGDAAGVEVADVVDVLAGWCRMTSPSMICMW